MCECCNNLLDYHKGLDEYTNAKMPQPLGTYLYAPIVTSKVYQTTLICVNPACEIYYVLLDMLMFAT